LRSQVAIDRVERRKPAHRLAEERDQRGFDKIQLRQITQCRISVERLTGQPPDAAAVGDAPRA
jgi:hypothetical protein